MDTGAHFLKPQLWARQDWGWREMKVESGTQGLPQGPCSQHTEPVSPDWTRPSGIPGASSPGPRPDRSQGC